MCVCWLRIVRSTVHVPLHVLARFSLPTFQRENFKCAIKCIASSQNKSLVAHNWFNGWFEKMLVGKFLGRFKAHFGIMQRDIALP